MKTLRLSGLLAMVFVIGTAVGWAKGPVAVDLQVSHPRLKAGEKQTMYVRVGLTTDPEAGGKKRAPVNVAIVLDKSGSMSSGGKIEAAREAAITALRRLDPQDIVSIVTYDSTIEVLVPATKASDREAIEAKIRQINTGSSTALFAGVSKGAEELRKFIGEERISRVLLLSDGLANVGPQSPAELGELGAALAKEGIAVSTIGLGLDYNEDLMAKLASRSDGMHFFASNTSKLASIFDEAMGQAQRVVAQQLRIDVDLGEGIRPVRVLGREAEISGRKVRVDLNQLFAGRERSILIEIEVPAGKPGQHLKVASAKARYRSAIDGREFEGPAEVKAEYSADAAEVERNVNAVVMVPVVELIATENNQRAMLLRDQGQIAEARTVLSLNNRLLLDNAVKFDSERLRLYGVQNTGDAANLEEGKYQQRRKEMVEQQSSNKY